MNYCKIFDCDVANGPGLRVSLFVSGCTNHCEGCFQPETWDFGYGEKYTEETEDRILKLLDRPYIKGLTLLGGDPFEPSNQRGLYTLIHSVKNLYPDKDIWAYTGFIYEQLIKEGTHCHINITNEILSMIDVLVDGPFILAQKDITLKFRGSKNQRLIDMKKTLETGEVNLVQ